MADIRLIVASEIDAAIGLLVEVYGKEVETSASQEVRRMFSSEACRPVFLGTFDTDGLIALAAVVECAFTVETYGLGWVAVKPSYQRKGRIGSKLVLAAIAYTAKDLLKGRPGSLILGAYDNLVEYYRHLGFSGATPMHEHSQFMSVVLNEPPAS